MTDIHTLLRKLASIEPSDLPVLSVYLDMHPDATGVRSGETVLKDRMREIEKSLLPRGPGLDSVRADAARILEFATDESHREHSGLAIFACDGAGLFETVPSGVPFTNQVTADAQPDLFQLVRLLDDFETAVVAVVDSNTLRIFVVASGAIEEVDGLDEDSVHFRKRATGGFSQARYQRHITKHRTDFAREAARDIEALIAQEGAVRLILAGDEVAMPLLLEALSPASRELLAGDPLRIDIRAQRDDIGEEVSLVLQAAEREESAAVVDTLFASVRRGLGVFGEQATKAALGLGQVDVLVLDSAYVSEELRAELTRDAVATSAEVEVIEENEPLMHYGGVGALLRWQI